MPSVSPLMTQVNAVVVVQEPVGTDDPRAVRVAVYPVTADPLLVAGAAQEAFTRPSPLDTATLSGTLGTPPTTAQLNGALDADTPVASRAVTTMPLEVLAVAGEVPLIRPVDVFSVSQDGRLVAEYVSGAVPPLTRVDTSRLAAVLGATVWFPGFATAGAALTLTTNAALLTVAPALSVTLTVTALNVCAELVIVPVISPVLLMVRVAGPLFNAYVHGALAQLVVSGRLHESPVVTAWLPGEVTVGLE